MFSTKTLFLGVYASNGVIRALFLPSCYLFLSSPFIALAIRGFRINLNSLSSSLIPESFKTPAILPQIFVSLVAVLLVTRAISGQLNASSKDGRGKRRVQSLPYWIPGTKHWSDIVFGGESWLKRVRESSITGIVAYNTAGTKHNLILSVPLLDQILGNSAFLEEADFTKWTILRHVFGLPQNAKQQYLELRSGISETVEAEVLKGAQLKNISSAFLRSLSQSLPDLITFNSSVVDQLPWERVAGVELSDGTDEVECDLFALVNEFVCNSIIPLITGPVFLESYQLLGSDLATLNQSFYGLAMGFPRFFPVPGLPSASLAKLRLLQSFTRLFDEVANPPVKREVEDDESMSGEETDADTPTLITALHELFAEHDLPLQARASIALEFVHRLVSQAVPLTFWTLVHTYSSSSFTTETKEEDKEETPVYRVKQETKDWAEALQPPSIHPSFPSPPEISFTSLAPLFNPSAQTYLRSCINESRRLYSAPITTARVIKPITFSEPENIRPGNPEEWELEVGSYIDVGLSQTLINTSSTNYLSPEPYKPDRFAHSQSPNPLSGSLFDDSEELVTALLIALVAGIVQLWDIKAAPKKSLYEQWQEAQAEASGQDPKAIKEGKEKKVGVWSIPKAVDGASVKVPKGDIRVRIRRREGLDRPKTMRKGR